MKKFLAVLLTAAVICTSLAGCTKKDDAPAGTGTNPASSQPAVADKPAEAQIVIKISHQNAGTHPIQLGLLEFKRLLEEKSGGTMTCDIYDSAVLGNDASNITQVAGNTLDAAMIMGVCLWCGYDERANFEELPFLFENYEEAWAAYDGELGKWVAQEIIEPNGGKVVGYWENGMRNFTNNKRPIYKPEDLAGMKFRCPPITIHLDMFEQFGASAIPMAFSELYTALQQGTVDGQCNPLGNIVASSLYEVQHYISMSRHIYNTSVFLFSNSFWDSLTPEQQGWITECSAEAAVYTRKINQDQEEEYMQKMKDYGCEINEIDRDAFLEAITPLWQKYTKEYGNEFITAAQHYISDPDSLAKQFGQK